MTNRVFEMIDRRAAMAGNERLDGNAAEARPRCRVLKTAGRGELPRAGIRVAANAKKEHASRRDTGHVAKQRAHWTKRAFLRETGVATRPRLVSSATGDAHWVVHATATRSLAECDC